MKEEILIAIKENLEKIYRLEEKISDLKEYNRNLLNSLKLIDV